MSSRLKERGGAGGKVMAGRPPPDGTPKEKSSATTSASFARKTPVHGKENNRRSGSTGKSSVPRQRPAPPPALPPDPLKKPVLVPAGVRWSTSSLPRGKPSAATAVDLRPSRLSGRDTEVQGLPKRKSLSGLTVLERCQNKQVEPNPGCKGKEDAKPLAGSRFSDGISANGVSGSNLGKTAVKLGESFINKAVTRSVSSEVFSAKQAKLEVATSEKQSQALPDEENSVVLGKKKSITMGRRTVGICNSVDDKPANCTAAAPTGVDDGEKITTSTGTGIGASNNSMGGDPGVHLLKNKLDIPHNSTGISETSNNKSYPDLNIKSTADVNTCDGITVFERSNELKDEKDTKTVACKYPSKLHEKLAMLEGKVQRIATDIKRTKEMLDSNNPDASKLILSDIQSKIMGIEKAVGRVIDGTTGVFEKTNAVYEDNCPLKHMERKSIVKANYVGNLINPGKTLNHDELEARFFPHHRLLKGRSAQGSSLSGEHDKICHSVVPGRGHGFENVPLSPIDDNPVALEFLASLDGNDSKISKRDRIGKPDFSVIQEMGPESTTTSSSQRPTMNLVAGQNNNDVSFLSDEKLDNFEDQENKPIMMPKEESEEFAMDQLFDIGLKPSTGGWFVLEGEAALLSHSDGTCSYYDVANIEEKAEFKPPAGVPTNLWGDCWLIRAPGADGCAGRYVVAASAGNSLDSGFCSWDFYNKDIQAFRLEEGTATGPSSSRGVLSTLPNSGINRRSSSIFTMPSSENQQWWYKPCGYLIASTSSIQTAISAYDVRDGCLVMTWTVQNPVVSMEYSSPLQWRSRGKAVVAETEAVSLWDINSLNPQPLVSVSTAGKRISALHINNTDAELGGGVRQRVSSSEAEGNDGVFCTQDSINVFDFRLPSGVGLKIPKTGCAAYSIYSRGDAILLGSTQTRPTTNNGSHSGIQHLSIRKGMSVAHYSLPDAKAHRDHTSIAQVWGNSNIVMGICGMGLFVFDALKDGSMECYPTDIGKMVEVKETIGSRDLYCPSFDYLGERVLLISRDRPAMWRFLL